MPSSLISSRTTELLNEEELELPVWDTTASSFCGVLSLLRPLVCEQSRRNFMLVNVESLLGELEDSIRKAEKFCAAEELRNATAFLLCNDLRKERALLANWENPTRGGGYRSTHPPRSNTMQWPKVTVTHMMSSLGTMEKLMSYYRDLKLADNLNDEDLRCFLEEQLCKEKCGLSEMNISSRLNTRKHVPSALGETPDSCSICMVDYKEQDKIASLFYCTHEYHEHCIKEWLLKSNICPMCRALAIIPEDYPSWDGDVKLHQAFFVQGKCTT